MKIFFIMGWRNLWRNKRRSLVVISSVSLGIFAMIISIAIMNGMNNQMVENTIKTSLGHIAIHKKGFQDHMKLKYNFDLSMKILNIVSEDNRISAYAPKVKLQGMIRSSEASRGVMIVGIDSKAEKRVSSIFEYTIKNNGSRFLLSRNDDSILISKNIAEKLDLLIGDRIVILLQNMYNEIVGAGMKVRGFFHTPIDSFDKFFVFMGIEKLQELSGIGKNITELTVIVNNSRLVDDVKESLLTYIDNKELKILSWKDMAPNLVSAVRLFDSLMYIFFMIIFITVIFSVTNTLIMSIMERFHEIGVMKSIGTKPLWIFYIVMFEAINLGIVGLFAGIITGIAITGIFAITGIDFSFYMETMRTWGTGSIIYPSIKLMDIVAATLIVFITTVIAALYPATKAARIKPLDALHYV